MISTQYTVATPHGQFQALWDEDEAKPVSYQGDASALAYFRAYMDLQMVVGAAGERLSADTLEPGELYGFCQSREYGVTVTMDPDALAAMLLDDLDDEDGQALVLDGVESPEQELTRLLGQMREYAPEGALVQMAQRVIQLVPLVAFDTEAEEEAAVSLASEILAEVGNE